MERIEKKTNIHISTSIEGFLNHILRGGDDWKYVQDDQGKPYPSKESVTDELIQKLAQGQKYLPSVGCGESFDPVTGCPGHTFFRCSDGKEFDSNIKALKWERFLLNKELIALHEVHKAIDQELMKATNSLDMAA